MCLLMSGLPLTLTLLTDSQLLHPHFLPTCPCPPEGGSGHPEPTSVTRVEELSWRAFCLLPFVSSNESPSLQGMYIFLHTVKGTPFETPDQGKARLLTHWEQMDYGVQFTASRKFLTITPIVL